MAQTRILPLAFAFIFAFAIVQLASGDHEANYEIKGDLPTLEILKSLGHNLILGRRARGDRILYRTVVKESSTRVITRDVRYNGRANITFISVIDLSRGGTGGYPSLIQGGIGKRNATIRLRSQPRFGLNFTISIFGK